MISSQTYKKLITQAYCFGINEDFKIYFHYLSKEARIAETPTYGRLKEKEADIAL